jgi:predicted site-specific integrase-resolvase
MPDYLTIAQVARLKQANRNTVAKWIKQGDLTVMEIAGRRFIVQDDKLDKIHVTKQAGSFAIRISNLEKTVEALRREVEQLKTTIEQS